MDLAHGSVCLLMLQQYHIVFISGVLGTLETRYRSPPVLFLFQNVLTIPVPLPFHMDFRVSLLIPTKDIAELPGKRAEQVNAVLIQVTVTL